LLAWARGLVGGPGLVAVEDVRHLPGAWSGTCSRPGSRWC